jgi:hypothetical protein
MAASEVMHPAAGITPPPVDVVLSSLALTTAILTPVSAATGTFPPPSSFCPPCVAAAPSAVRSPPARDILRFCPFLFFSNGGHIMASFPGAKVHRVDRRKLGRGQAPQIPPAAVTVSTVSADVFKIVSSIPGVFATNGAGITVATLTFVSAAQVSQTELDVTMSGALTGHAYTVPANILTTFMGGGSAATSGTF